MPFVTCRDWLLSVDPLTPDTLLYVNNRLNRWRHSSCQVWAETRMSSKIVFLQISNSRFVKKFGKLNTLCNEIKEKGFKNIFIEKLSRWWDLRWRRSKMKETVLRIPFRLRIPIIPHFDPITAHCHTPYPHVDVTSLASLLVYRRRGGHYGDISFNSLR